MPKPRLAAMVLACTLLITGCEPDGRPGGATQVGRRATVALVGLPESDPMGRVLAGGARRYQRDVPSVHVDVVVPTDIGLHARLHALESAAAQLPDAICLYLAPGEVERNAALLRARLPHLNSRGAPIITIGARLDAERVAGHVGVNLPDAAMLAGEHLAELARPHRTFILVHNDQRGDVERDAAQRLRSAAAAQAGLVLLREIDGDDPQHGLRDRIAEATSLFPNCGLIVTLDPSVWIDAPLEWERLIRERNKVIHFVTLSADPRLWRRLGTPAEPGSAAGLVGPLDGELTYQAVRMAVELVTGQRRTRSDRWVNVELVDREDLSDFAARYAKAAGDADLSSFLPRGASTQPTTRP